MHYILTLALRLWYVYLSPKIRNILCVSRRKQPKVRLFADSAEGFRMSRIRASERLQIMCHANTNMYMNNVT